LSLGLKPAKYLEMLQEEYAEYKADPASMRKAINCCAHSNALPEIIFAEYGSGAPEVQGATTYEQYRKHLRLRESQAHHTVRDICEFSKHGPGLHRQRPKTTPERKVSVQGAKVESAYQLLLALTNHSLVITHQDGRTEYMDEVLAQVVASWEGLFERDGL
jgi:hypothetical protein